MRDLIPYSQTKEYRREYMRQRRADPIFRQREYSRDRELDKTPERRKKHADQARNRGRLRKLEAVQYLGGVCKDCQQEYHPAVYEFHHLEPLEKDMNGSQFLQRKREDMFKELDKCVLLCANCHRMRHHNWEDSGV